MHTRLLIISIFTPAAMTEHMQYSDDTRLYTTVEARYPASTSEKVAVETLSTI